MTMFGWRNRLIMVVSCQKSSRGQPHLLFGYGHLLDDLNAIASPILALHIGSIFEYPLFLDFGCLDAFDRNKYAPPLTFEDLAKGTGANAFDHFELGEFDV